MTEFYWKYIAGPVMFAGTLLYQVSCFIWNVVMRREQ